MGQADRDYMRERRSADDSPFTAGESRSGSALWQVAWWVVIGLVLFMAFNRWAAEKRANDQVQRQASVPSGIERQGPAALPPRQPVVRAPQAAESSQRPAVRRCSDRTGVTFTDGDCANGQVHHPVKAEAGPVRHIEREDNGVTPGTIYQCRAYDGRVFWAQAHCNRHRAHITRIASVPDGLPFEQQVEIATHKMKQDAHLAAAAQAPPTPQQVAQHSTKALCAALDAEVRRIDVITRQPLPASAQDYWREKRKLVRDEQFRIPCR